MKKVMVFTASLILLASFTAMGQQVETRSNTGRQVSQQARIQQGRASGELNRTETARLQREQRRIQAEKRIVNADGTVTPGEKRFLRREQNRANRHIARQKHDAQGR